MIYARYRTDPRRIEARLDELYFLNNAYERGFYAGIVRGSSWGRNQCTLDEAFKVPRSPFYRLAKHYERQLKRTERKR